MYYIYSGISKVTFAAMGSPATVTSIFEVQPSSAAAQKVFSLVNSGIRIHLPARIIITRQ